MLKYLIIVVLLSSCSLFNDYSWMGIEEVKTINDTIDYMKENISYQLDI